MKSELRRNADMMARWKSDASYKYMQRTTCEAAAISSTALRRQVTVVNTSIAHSSVGLPFVALVDSLSTSTARGAAAVISGVRDNVSRSAAEVVRRALRGFQLRLRPQRQCVGQRHSPHTPHARERKIGAPPPLRLPIVLFRLIDAPARMHPATIERATLRVSSWLRSHWDIGMRGCEHQGSSAWKQQKRHLWDSNPRGETPSA